MKIRYGKAAEGILRIRKFGSEEGYRQIREEKYHEIEHQGQGGRKISRSKG